MNIGDRREIRAPFRHVCQREIRARTGVGDEVAAPKLPLLRTAIQRAGPGQ